MTHLHGAAPAGGTRAQRIGAAGLAVFQALTMATAIASLIAILFGLAAIAGALRTAQAQGVSGVAPPAGLFFRTEQADTALEAPLLRSDVEIGVNGLVARVKVRQHFVNPTDAWMEGVYVFPLPERAAVDRLTLLVGERRIEGAIMAREEARKTYDQAAADSKRASLLSAERPNVFTTSVANIGPGEEIVVEFEYQDAAAFADGRFTLRFPLVVAPRYTPGAEPTLVAGPVTAPPGEGRDVFGPVRHPDDGPVNPVALAITLDAGLPLAEVKSLSHDVTIAAKGEGRRIITLRDGAVPADRDFVLEWRPRVGAAPEPAVFAEQVGGDSYLLVMVLPPEAAEAPPPISRDLVFVVDTSGSMHGPSLDQAKAAMLPALDRLRPGDRFNVIRFANATHALFDGPRPVTARTRRAAAAYVAGLGAEGGTEMMPALLRALSRQTDDARLRQVVFLTDGAVGNEAELFQFITAMLGESRLFTVGIGSAPNSHFMRKAAELGRGSFTYIGDVAEVSERTGALFRKLERPELAGIAHTWPVVAESRPESYPAPMPDLYAGEPVVLTAHLPGVGLDDLQGTVRMTGRRGAEAWQRAVPLDGLRPAAGVAAIWARAKIDHIEDARFRGADPDQVRTQALEVALAHRLVTRYTSLVAVDDRPARPGDTPMQSHEIERNLPHGWDFAHVFGELQRDMQPRALPPSLLRKASGPTGAIALPQTATPAPLHALIGLAALGLGITVLLLMRRRPAFGDSHA